MREIFDIFRAQNPEKSQVPDTQGARRNNRFQNPREERGVGKVVLRPTIGASAPALRKERIKWPEHIGGPGGAKFHEILGGTILIVNYKAGYLGGVNAREKMCDVK